MFSTPTYIVLDLPPSVGKAVLALRARYDAIEANLPAEITVAGSSGIGTIAAGQSPVAAAQAIERVGKSHLPFSTAFASMERFPGTQIYWLKPRDRSPFDAIQSALVAEGIRFNENPFPFNPHCTISATVELTTEQEEELQMCEFPGQEFSLSRIGVYQLDAGDVSLLQSFFFPA